MIHSDFFICILEQLSWGEILCFIHVFVMPVYASNSCVLQEICNSAPWGHTFRWVAEFVHMSDFGPAWKKYARSFAEIFIYSICLLFWQHINSERIVEPPLNGDTLRAFTEVYSGFWIFDLLSATAAYLFPLSESNCFFLILYIKFWWFYP